MPLPRITELAHYLVGNVLREGDRAVDATAGNGHDTIFLARLVGNSGQVDAFDIQSEAIQSTRQQVISLPQVRLHQIGHEKMETVIDTPVRTVMFNLGYLPSGNRDLITLPETTLTALDTSVKLLEPGGLLTVIVYPAHDGGSKEAFHVDEWFEALNRLTCKVWRCGEWSMPNGTLGSTKKPAPYLFVAERRR